MFVVSQFSMHNGLTDFKNEPSDSLIYRVIKYMQ